MRKFILLFVFISPLLVWGQDVKMLPASGSKSLNLNPLSKSGITWLFPESSYKGEQFERIEFAVDLPQSIDTKIAHFLSTDDSTTGINPFLEWQLDVTATFYHSATQTTKAVDAFFYQEFDRDTTNSDYRKWEWISLETPHFMRVRFAPPRSGEWTCAVQITTKTDTLNLSPFDFEVTRSNNPGYIKIGESKRFFKLGEETFFPTGQNIVSPRCEFCFTNSLKDLPTPENPKTYQSFEGWTLDPTILKGFLMYQDHIRGLAKGGGNYFRQILMPQNQDIEWEKLGNYYGRLNRAWEIDEQFFIAEELNLKMQLNVQIQFALETSRDRIFWNWSTDPEDKRHASAQNPCANPYNRQISTTKNDDPNTFYSDATAKKFYKQKLRYIVSRWGYSTSLSVLGMSSEMEGCCTVSEICVTWMEEMGHYLKRELEINQLLAPSFLGAFMDAVNYEHKILALEYYDFSAYNGYSVAPAKFEGIGRIVKHFNTSFQKPFYFGEFGSSGIYDCDTARIEWVRDAWMSAFSGNAGVGMNWDEPFDDELRYHLGNINTLVSGIDFDGNGQAWESRRVISDNRKAETLFLMSPNEDFAVGVISNRYYNWYLYADTLENEAICQGIAPRDPGFDYTKPAAEKGVWEREYDESPLSYIDRVSRNTLMNDPVSYTPFEAFNYDTDKHYRLRIYGLKRALYSIDFYNALTMEYLGSETNWGPNVQLEYPEMTAESGLIAFKLRLKDEDFPQLKVEDRIAIDYSTATITQTDTLCTVSNNRYNLKFDRKNKEFSLNLKGEEEPTFAEITIADEDGTILFTKSFKGTAYKSSFPTNKTKNYTVKININRMIYTEDMRF